jgi:arylsulfatase A-like enzyme
MSFYQISFAFFIWVSIFVLATFWEFVFRVIFLHPSWTLSNAISRLLPNLAAAAVAGLASGMIYALLLMLFRNRTRWMLPSAAVVLALFAAIPAGHGLFRVVSAQPGWIRWITAIVATLIVYGLVFVALRTLILRRRWKLVPVFLILVPILLLIAVSLYRNRLQPVSKGSVRHIVLISIDTLRHDYVSAYDPRNVRTPVLDQIASEGARFEVAIAPVPQTGPSHISMLTGLSPLDHGILENGQPLPREAKTIAHQLREAGYQTAGFVSGYPLKQFNCNLQMGFGVYDDFLAFNDRFRDVYYGELLGSLPFFQWGVYRQAQEVTDPALHWLQKNAASPFFLFLHYYDPHYPYGIKEQRRAFRRPMFVKIPKSDVVNQKRLYAQEVRSVDDQIQRVIDFLRRAGIYDQTLLIVTADHGESLGEHDFFYSHERYIYEQMIRVPLMIRNPVLVEPGTVFQKQVAMLDVYRTIASAAHIKPMPGDRGLNLIELIQNDSSQYERMIPSYHFGYDVEGIRSDRWKLIHNRKMKSKRFELYDLQTDPGEMINRFESEPEIAKLLMQHLPSNEALRKGSKHLTEEQMEVLRSLGYIQ